MRSIRLICNYVVAGLHFMCLIFLSQTFYDLKIPNTTSFMLILLFHSMNSWLQRKVDSKIFFDETLLLMQSRCRVNIHFHFAAKYLPKTAFNDWKFSKKDGFRLNVRFRVLTCQNGVHPPYKYNHVNLRRQSNNCRP